MVLKENSYLQNGKYKILRTLGQGGFGITYLAEQVMMERKVCIKEFFLKDYCDRNPSDGEVSFGTANNRSFMEKYQEKFVKEARMIARLDHPNIIRIHDVFRENNTAYYVTDYIDGISLSELVKNRGALAEEDALKYIKAIGKGLSYVHSKGINHLDVKPSNIMLRFDGTPILIDFGMSKQYDESGEQTSSTPVGVSAGYAPIEQNQVGGVTEFTPQTDIYSLGATLFYLVTGNVPPLASDVMNDGLPALPQYISESTNAAIEKAMQFRKKLRPASVDEFISLLPSDVKEIPISTTSSISMEHQPVADVEEPTILVKDHSTVLDISTEIKSVKSESKQTQLKEFKSIKWIFLICIIGMLFVAGVSVRKYYSLIPYEVCVDFTNKNCTVPSAFNASIYHNGVFLGSFNTKEKVYAKVKEGALIEAKSRGWQSNSVSTSGRRDINLSICSWIPKYINSCNAEYTDYIKKRISEYGDVKSVSFANNASVCLFKSGRAGSCGIEKYSGLWDVVTDNMDVFSLDDIVIKSDGSFLFIYDRGKEYFEKGIPKDMSSKIWSYYCENESIISADWDRDGNWAIITDKHINANPSDLLDWLTEIQSKGDITSICFDENGYGAVAVASNKMYTRGTMPENLVKFVTEEHTLRKLYRVKIWQDKFFYCDKDGSNCFFNM